MPLRPLVVGVLVRLSPFWGAYDGPQDARVVKVVGDWVTVRPPLGGTDLWQRRELRRSARMAGKARGFGTLPPDERRAVASKGGFAAHASGRAHEWDSEQARAAGRKGGRAPKKTKRARGTDEKPRT